MQSHTIAGGGDVELNVDETGDSDEQSILFIHGYTQSRLSWMKQMESDLAEDFHLLALDNRGHGQSDKPRDAYTDSDIWADDIQSIIDHFELSQPVLVGWSYGGLIISDFLGKYGDEHIGGINLVGAISKLGTEDALAVIGEDFMNQIPGFESQDVEESVEALRTFVKDCAYAEFDPADLSLILGFNVIVPPHVRESLHSRTVTHDDDLRAVEKPVLITHGEEDGIVLPAAAEEHAELIERAEISFYPDVGHSPFWEAADRFNRELREFVEFR